MKLNLFQNHPNFGGQYFNPDLNTKVEVKQEAIDFEGN